MAAPQNIAMVGDLHCGSHCGLWPVDELPGGAAGRKYKDIRYLNECFDTMVKRWPSLDLLVLMGDLVDGKQKKSNSVGLFTADMNEQVNGAIEVLRPLCNKAKKIIRVTGTPYHEEFDNCLSALDKEYGVARSEQILNIDIGGRILNVAHHPAAGSSLYYGSAVDKENLWATVAAAEKNCPDPRWIVRAHKHTWIFQETRHKTVCITPCFELPTAHAKKQNYWRFQPSIGGLLMHADRSHDSGYRFTASLFDVPMPAVIPINDLRDWR